MQGHGSKILGRMNKTSNNRKVRAPEKPQSINRLDKQRRDIDDVIWQQKLGLFGFMNTAADNDKSKVSDFDDSIAITGQTYKIQEGAMVGKKATASQVEEPEIVIAVNNYKGQ